MAVTAFKGLNYSWTKYIMKYEDILCDILTVCSKYVANQCLNKRSLIKVTTKDTAEEF